MATSVFLPSGTRCAATRASRKSFSRLRRNKKQGGSTAPSGDVILAPKADNFVASSKGLLDPPSEFRLAKAGRSRRNDQVGAIDSESFRELTQSPAKDRRKLFGQFPTDEQRQSARKRYERDSWCKTKVQCAWVQEAMLQ